MQAGPVRVWVVVPATPVSDQHVQAAIVPNEWVRADLQAPLTPEEHAQQPDAYQVAEARLEYALQMLRDLGVPADGEVGDDNPLHAVEAFLRDHTVDEVIVSTLPHHLSHWLRMDLPARIHRHVDLPGTTITSSVPEPTRA